MSVPTAVSRGAKWKAVNILFSNNNTFYHNILFHGIHSTRLTIKESSRVHKVLKLCLG